MLFDNWEGIIRTLVVGTLAYIALVFMVRISGKRTLAKMNAFDLIVTVALGSTLATILLSEDVALAEGVTAFLTLIALQFTVAWLSVRSKTVREMVKSTPRLLYYRQSFLDEALRYERVTQEELYAAVRAEGFATFDDVEAVVLETDGTFTVINSSTDKASTTLKYVKSEDGVTE